jgi:hypothetical protein
MTDTPLSPELVDELLSADLDGEFDAAARDLGLDPTAARAQLDAMPDVAARRAALAQAPGALAVPPLADDVRERLVRTALAAGPADELTERRNRRRSLFTVAGSIAAALLVVVGAVAVINGGDSRGGDDSAGVAVSDEAYSPDATTAAGEVFAPTVGGQVSTVNLGEIADEQALRAALDPVITYNLMLDDNAADEGFASEDAGRDSTALPETDAASPPPASTRPDGDLGDVARTCLPEQVAGAPADGTLVLDGSATYAGVPAQVLVFARVENNVVVVVRADDCAPLVVTELDR